MSSSDSDSDETPDFDDDETPDFDDDETPDFDVDETPDFDDDETPDFKTDNSSDESSDEEAIDDSWTNRRNIFISVYNSSNLINTTLITNYNELHSYRERYKKLSKKSTDNIKNIWSEIKVNVPNYGIVPLKSYGKDLIEDSKDKNKEIKQTVVPKQKETLVASTKPPDVMQDQNPKTTPKPVTSNKINLKVVAKADNKSQINTTSVTNKSMKENNSTRTAKNKEIDSHIGIKNKENESKQNRKTGAQAKVSKTTEGNTTTVNSSKKNNEKDKGVKVDIVVLNATKSEPAKKNVQAQSSNATVKLNENKKNANNNAKESEFKKPQNKTESNKNKTSKNSFKELVSTTKSKKQNKKNSNSQCSENSESGKRSDSIDNCKKNPVKEKVMKKIEEPEDNETTDNDDDDDDEEIIDNMDALTGNSEVIDDEMLEFVKYKDTKKQPVETSKAADKKINSKNYIDQNTPVSSVKNNLSSSTSEKNYVHYSEKFAEDAVDMILENNLIGGLESLHEAMEYNPGDDRHYLNRSYCYLRLSRPALALADAQYILQTSTHYGHRFIAYLRAGQASMALQKYAQAENYLKDSLSINSDNLYAQRELMRAKISRIVSLGYTERNAVLALLKYSKTQEAISYLANRNFADSESKSDDFSRNFNDIDDLDDLIYSSDEDEKSNCATLINNILNYKPPVKRLTHLLAKPANFSASTIKNGTNEFKKKNSNSTSNSGSVMERAIWVGSLTKNINEAVLKKHFKEYGTVISVYRPPNEAYGFVNFEKSEHVANVLRNPSASEINGHKLVVRQGMYSKIT